MDKMTLKGMRFFGYHGVFPEENRLGQQFYVDLELLFDMQQAAHTDELDHALDYSAVHSFIKGIVEGPPFKLIEALTGHLASQVLEHYTIVNEVTVRVTKPHPPFDVQFDGVTIEMNRKRADYV